MPIFSSQYPANSNPAGEDKILTTDTSDADAVKSVTLTKLQEWLASVSKWVVTSMIADGAVNSDKIDFTTFGLGGDQYKSSFTSGVTPSTNRNGHGYGSSTIDISSLNATSIIGVWFTGKSDRMLWGVASSSTTEINIYGYRVEGTFGSNITCGVVVVYTK